MDRPTIKLDRQYRPIISEAEIRREGRPPWHDGRPPVFVTHTLQGPIEAGEVFAWMPDDPDQRQLVVVKCIDPHCLRVLVWDFPDYRILTDHDELAFRGGAYRTQFNLMPSEPYRDHPLWLKDFSFPGDVKP